MLWEEVGGTPGPNGKVSAAQPAATLVALLATTIVQPADNQSQAESQAAVLVEGREFQAVCHAVKTRGSPACEMAGATAV